MEIVGVIQYRLIGSHPAAQGRNATISFPGESIPLSEVLAKLVRENSINENRYKLDVVRLTSPPGSSVTTTEPVSRSTVLQNYDRITVNISTRQLQEALATAEEAEQRDEELREREGELAVEAVEAVVGIDDFGPVRRLEDAKGAPASLATSVAATSTRAGEDGGKAGSARDALELERAARVAARRFPVHPGKRKDAGESGAQDTDGGEGHAEALCDLCELPAFEPLTRPCCGAVVCSCCYESAALMTAHEGECPVCGTVNGTVRHVQATLNPTSAALKREAGEAKLFARPAAATSFIASATSHLTAPTAHVGSSPTALPTSLSGNAARDGHSGAALSMANGTHTASASPVATSAHMADTLGRPACLDHGLQAYETRLHQSLPSIARFLRDPAT